jgi:hypothetical protein
MGGSPKAELKSWMSGMALVGVPSLEADAKLVGAAFPGSAYYNEGIRRYIAAWKSYWDEYIPEMIATRADPKGGAWGGMPAMASAGKSNACQSYNVMTYSFTPATLRGIIFLAGPGTVAKDKGANFGPEMSALANSWKREFTRGSGDDVPFFYTVPDKAAAPKLTMPKGIKGKSAALKGGDWTAIEKFIGDLAGQ